MGYITNQNQEIFIAKASSRSIFRWIFAYSYFAFDNFFKIKKWKNLKKR